MAESPFRIELSEEEERELRSRAARYTTADGVVLRAKIVLRAAEGETNAEIARRLDCSLRTVSLRGASASSRSVSTVLWTERGRAVRAVFPPEEVAQVKAIACQLPREHGVPVSRFSRAELHGSTMRTAAARGAERALQWCQKQAKGGAKTCREGPPAAGGRICAPPWAPIGQARSVSRRRHAFGVD